MKRCNVLLTAATCLMLGAALTTLWICVIIGFGIHTTVGKEAIYLWLVLQALWLAAAAVRLRRGSAAVGKRLRAAIRLLVCLWGAGAAALLFSLGAALTGASYGSVWVALPCSVGVLFTCVGVAGLLIALRKFYFNRKEHNA